MPITPSIIIPTILSDSLSDIQFHIDTLAKIEQNPMVDVPSQIQLDVIDGLYAENLTIFPHDLVQINWQGFTTEIHLLVNDPEEYLGETAEMGAKQVIAQIEHLGDRVDFLTVGHQLGMRAGLALDLYTPVSELSNEELNKADVILLMSVKAGFSGQTYNPLVLEKIKQLRDRDYHQDIEIDGGVNEINMPDLLHAGATKLAVNSSLWQDDVVANLHKLQKSTKESTAHAQNT
jgi:ribulose-phosphate 3-epimerase